MTLSPQPAEADQPVRQQHPSKTELRLDREAAALRENLRRRKQQARARQMAKPDPSQT